MNIFSLVYFWELCCFPLPRDLRSAGSPVCMVGRCSGPCILPLHEHQTPSRDSVSTLSPARRCWPRATLAHQHRVVLTTMAWVRGCAQRGKSFLFWRFSFSLKFYSCYYPQVLGILSAIALILWIKLGILGIFVTLY